MLEGLIGLVPLVPLLLPPFLGVAFVLIVWVLTFLSDPGAMLDVRIEELRAIASGIMQLVGALIGTSALVSVIFFEGSTARSRFRALTTLLGLLAGLTVAVLWLCAMAAKGPLDRPYGWTWSTLALLLTGPTIIAVGRIVWILRHLLTRR